MKTFRLFATVLMVALCAMAVTSCSDDDDDKGNDSIVGKWKVMEQGYTNDWYQFTSDKKFEYYHADGKYSEYGKYKVESGKLYMMFSDEEDWIIYKINELNSISLIIQEYDEDGKLTDWTESFQRIN